MKKKEFYSPPRRVALFVTCMVDMMYPEVGMATVELLERHGVEVLFPLEQTCCGQPAFNAGFRDEARQLAHRFIEIFEPMLMAGEIEAVVAPSGSCVTMTTHFYQMLFQGGASNELLRRAETLASVTFELTEFLVDVLGVGHTNARFPHKVTYHACCHLLRELRIDEQPRALLNNVGDAQVIDHDESDGCCGFGGLFAVKNAAISTAMGERKIHNLAKSGAEVVTMCDVSCMTHINGLLQKQGQPAKAIHISEVLNAQIASKGEAASATPEPPAPSSQSTRPKSAGSTPARPKPARPKSARQNPARKEEDVVRPSKPRRWQQ